MFAFVYGKTQGQPKLKVYITKTWPVRPKNGDQYTEERKNPGQWGD